MCLWRFADTPPPAADPVPVTAAAPFALAGPTPLAADPLPVASRLLPLSAPTGEPTPGPAVSGPATAPAARLAADWFAAADLDLTPSRRGSTGRRHD